MTSYQPKIILYYFIFTILCTGAIYSEEPKEENLSFSFDSAKLREIPLTNVIVDLIVSRFVNNVNEKLPITLELDAAPVDMAVFSSLISRVRVKEIRLSRDQGDLLNLLAVASTIPDLVSVKIDQTALSEAAFSRLAKLEKLQFISLNNVDIDYVEWVSSLINLKIFQLNSCVVKPSIITQLLKLPKLEMLMVSHTRFERFIDIANVAKSSSVTSIDLVDCNLTDADFIPWLGSCLKLNRLNLEGNRVNGQFCSAIKNMKELSLLLLTGTLFDNEHVYLLNGADALQDLGLSDTLLSDESVVDLLKLPKLSGMTLSRTKMSLKGLSLIMRSPKIIGIGLEDIGLTDDDLVTLVGLDNSNLERLGLAKNKLTDRSIATIKSMKALKKINLFKNAFSRDAVESLRKSRPETLIGF